MADLEHLAILKQGVRVWNAWRDDNRGARPHFDDANFRGEDLTQADLAQAKFRGADLTQVKLTRANLRGADLTLVNLSGADLTQAKLTQANFSGANLTPANLTQANLSGADLTQANLRAAELTQAKLVDATLNAADLSCANLIQANLTQANLRAADLSLANLIEADLSLADLGDASLSVTNLTFARLNGAHLGGAKLSNTILGAVDLSGAKGLDTCVHMMPSVLDHRTLELSGGLPLSFLRGCGLPERLIDYLPSLLNQAIQFYSCFISYSSKDQEFADRLHANLQNKGIRCWFAPHDLPIGAKTWDHIDQAIRLRDKLLLILSENAIASDWVEDEVNKAFAEERRRGQTMLFPVRLDNAVFDTDEAWALKLRDQRNIGDFTRWKEHDAYQKSLERVVTDLRMVDRSEALPSQR